LNGAFSGAALNNGQGATPAAISGAAADFRK
jgi:hypothetical protein